MSGHHRIDAHHRNVPPHYTSLRRERSLLPVGTDVPTCTSDNAPHGSLYSFTRGRAVDFVNAESKDYEMDENARTGLDRDKAKQLLSRLA